MARLNKNWTATNELEHWAWESFALAVDKWLRSLPPDHNAHIMSINDRAAAFFAAHPNGWPMHPDAPIGIGDGVQIVNLQIEPSTE